MARAISDEEIHLRERARRRLIGAVILVAAVVVALPMVLDSEPKRESGDISIRIPAPDANTFSPKMVPAPAARPEAKRDAGATAPARKAASPAAPTPLTAKPGSRPEFTAKAMKPAAAPPAKQASAPTPKPAADKTQEAATETKAAKQKPQDYVVQVIALADADRAKQMQRQIAATGLKSYTEVVDTAKGAVTRVRVGPFASREAAEKARGQLQGIGLDGKVIPR